MQMILGKLKGHIKEPLYKNSYYLMADTVINSILGFIFWIVIARLYTLQMIGLAVALFSAVTLVCSFSDWGTGQSIIRFLPGEEIREKIINTFLTIKGIFSILLSVIFVCGVSIWVPKLSFLKQEPLFFSSFLLFSVVTSLISFESYLFIAFKKTKYAFIQNTISMVLKIMLAVFLTQLGTLGIFSSYGISSLILLLVSIFIFTPRLCAGYRPYPTIDRRVINKTSDFAFTNYIAGIIGRVDEYILPLMIINILSAESNAYFRVATGIAGMVLMVPRAITVSLFAKSSHEPCKLKEDIVRSMKLILLLLLPALVLIFIFGDKILGLFGNEYKNNGLRLLWILSISSIPFAVNNLYITIKQVELKTKPIITIYSFIAVLMLGFSFLWIHKFGLIGAGWGFLIGQGLVALVSGIAMIGWMRKPLTRGQ